MNWLAHLFLSLPDGKHRLGNLLGDLVKGQERKELHSCFSAGIECHLKIDYFTDHHLVFKRSKRRISIEHRRYSGVLIDVFYDHFLARNWNDYSAVSLATFTEDVYNSFAEYWDVIPAFPRMVIYRMFEQDWLGSYYYLDGVEATLRRIRGKLSARYRDSFLVSAFLEELEVNYRELESDFQVFFPEIVFYLSQRRRCAEDV